MKVRGLWDDGSLLRAHGGAVQFSAIELPVRGPNPAQIGDDIVGVREWVSSLRTGSDGGRRYDVVMDRIGGRHIGRNDVPSRLVVSTLDQAWSLLGVRREVARFDGLLGLTVGTPAVSAWVLTHPQHALELADAMPRLLAAFSWLDDHRGSGKFLREITAPGVDTKFAEKQRPVLAAMLGVSSTPAGFLAGLGLRQKPEMVRIRVSPSLGLPAPISEMALRAPELRELVIAPRTAVVVENEVTYLSVDVPVDGIVLWGKGFDVNRVGRLPWLADVPVIYWGDIDTHGFAILDRLRAWLPTTRSILMDRETLLAHRERWGEEKSPSTSSLTRLTAAEHDLYTDLITDRLGPRVRLEQELVDWTAATTALEQAQRSKPG